MNVGGNLRHHRASDSANFLKAKQPLLIDFKEDNDSKIINSKKAVQQQH